MAKKWLPTPEILERVEELASKGVLQESIARIVGVAPTTFSSKRTEFPELDEAIKRGKASGETIVVGKLWELIESGHPTAILFWLKCQASWNDRPDQDNSTTNIFVDSDAKSKVRELITRKMKEKSEAA